MHNFKRDIEAVRERLLEIIEKYDYGELLFTLVPDENDIRLLETYPEEIKAWRDFMIPLYNVPEEDDPWSESNFHDVCRGFMAAKGVNDEDGHYLATFCRYNLQDFDPALKERAQRG